VAKAVGAECDGPKGLAKSDAVQVIRGATPKPLRRAGVVDGGVRGLVGESGQDVSPGAEESRDPNHPPPRSVERSRDEDSGYVTWLRLSTDPFDEDISRQVCDKVTVPPVLFPQI